VHDNICFISCVHTCCLDANWLLDVYDHSCGNYERMGPIVISLSPIITDCAHSEHWNVEPAVIPQPCGILEATVTCFSDTPGLRRVTPTLLEWRHKRIGSTVSEDTSSWKLLLVKSRESYWLLVTMLHCAYDLQVQVCAKSVVPPFHQLAANFPGIFSPITDLLFYYHYLMTSG
jgi:hypothetical protein